MTISTLIRTAVLLPALTAVLLATPPCIQAQVKQRIAVPEDAGRWITTAFAKGKVPPFSFIYGGKPSAEFIRKWKHTMQKEQSDDPQVVKYRISYLDPATGLRADCHVTGFREFNAVEWVMNFTNTSAENSDTLEQVKVVDYTMEAAADGDFKLLHAEGSYGSRADFRPILTELGAGDSIRMAPENGRSSDRTAFPFFNLGSPDKKGVVVGIGWTGSWYAALSHGGKAATLNSGMEKMKLYLLPGESIRTPRICMLFWQGDDPMDGNNRFRRFMLAHHTRKIDGKFAEYPLSAGFDWGDPAPCNEYGCLTEEFAVALINRYKQFGIVPEVFWLDAGWYEGSGGPDFSGGNWSTCVGNWIIDSTRFPRGLKPLSDAAHRVGAKFMVWFEPERAIVNSWLAKTHPEWMLSSSDKNPVQLFDLGNREACAWLSKYIGDLLEQNGIDYYRQDFNMGISPYWEANDEPGRTGMKEIRHVEGLYKFWDYLLDRFPRLMIDNCAAGGRRLDLETMSRSAPLWRTDYRYGEVNGYQCHTYGLNFFLPLHGTGIYGTDDYNFRSSLSSAMVINWEITSIRGSIPDMQRVIAEYKELRPYFYEDYYPLTGLGDLTGDDVWLAYQLNKPSDGTGIVVAFRRKDNPQGSTVVKLRGLDPQQVYSVQNGNDGKIAEKTGKELADGLTLEIGEAPGSLLLKYGPAEK